MKAENLPISPVTEDTLLIGAISQENLCRYLRRAVTVSLEHSYSAKPHDTHITAFLLNIGAKYVCRFATCWSPTVDDLKTHAAQKAFIDDLHQRDPDIILEACIFECISEQVSTLSIPAYVLEEFEQPITERCFSFDAMRFADGTYLHQWGTGTAVPDMTRIETQMFFYYRACTYIDLGYEALHLGQVHLIGKNDEGWKCWTAVLNKIRDYANKHARRNFVLLNAHTHGLIGSDGKLMFDFHMYPSRPMACGTQAHAPSKECAQECILKAGHVDSIYGKSLGGVTHSGWSCDTLPYLVELDNYGNEKELLDIPMPDDWRCWGMDEISWYANQPADYRKAFLTYALDWVTNQAEGIGFFAMPGQRVATYFDENRNPYSYIYLGYDPKNLPAGNNDEAFIKEIWTNDTI